MGAPREDAEADAGAGVENSFATADTSSDLTHPYTTYGRKIGPGGIYTSKNLKES
jgi:hypothetical protein